MKIDKKIEIVIFWSLFTLIYILLHKFLPDLIKEYIVPSTLIAIILILLNLYLTAKGENIPLKDRISSLEQKKSELLEKESALNQEISNLKQKNQALQKQISGNTHTHKPPYKSEPPPPNLGMGFKKE